VEGAGGLMGIIPLVQGAPPAYAIRRLTSVAWAFVCIRSKKFLDFRHETMFDRIERRLRAVVDGKFFKNNADVAFDGALG
jgi:hypothetical protein